MLSTIAIPTERLPRFLCDLVMTLLISATAVAAAPPDQSEWVRSSPSGALVYKTDSRGNRIPDFSNVGYRGGGVALPEAAVTVTIGPAPGDAGARIQAAIDEVSRIPPDANGLRGAVVLTKGRYLVAGSLYLHAGGVVLRGEGDHEDGTVLVATGAKQRSLIIVGGKEAHAPNEEEGNESVAFFGKGMSRQITDEYVPVGSRHFHLKDAAGLNVGEQIIVRRPSTAAWIHELGMDHIPTTSAHKVVQWKAGSKDLYFSRIITAINGQEITVNAPIVDALDRVYGGGEVLMPKASTSVGEVGVENLRGESEYKNSEDEAHGWVFVDLVDVHNAWVRKVTSVHFGYSCVYARKQSRAVTIEGCTCLDPISQITGGRRYSFDLDGELALVEHCYARNGRHDFVMGSVAAGPNVFFDCTAELSHADSGPHHRWSVGVLYDNVRVSPSPDERSKKGIGLNIRNRGNLGTGHGWAGANQVAWNCQAWEMMVEQPPTAQNWAIGCTAQLHSGNAYWESFGKPVEPRSLYQSQLKERLAAEEK